MKARPVEVGIPTRDAKPPLVQVALVVAVCFVLGIAWPRWAGLTLVPRPPGSENPASAASPGAAALGAASASAPNAAAVAPTASESSADHVRLLVQEAVVVSCRDGERRREGEHCDKPEVDSVMLPRLRALESCAGVERAAGVLSVGLELDFGSGKVVQVVRGKSTTLSQELSGQLLRCVQREVSTATLEGIEHRHQHYLYFYLVKLLPPGTPSTPEGWDAEGITQASGVVTVIWESAQVRALPEPSAEVRSRLLYGTRVRVAARKGDWYRVQYDGKGSEGWLHKKAVGL